MRPQSPPSQNNHSKLVYISVEWGRYSARHCGDKGICVKKREQVNHPQAMKLLIVIVLLGMAVLCLSRQGADRSNSVADSRSSEAFLSRQEAGNFARRHRRSNIHHQVSGGAVRSPLEAKREVCELNPDCDELADHIGFQEAYRRFYGPVLPSRR
ncbi:osteocalcin [Bombina bombina]|uniref:osteocalcin n=1 Tax=Bombina bombina TaxID=8345 RepID=UPI00235B16DD|nr:osteocalcin [Bombina bombina]